MINHCGTVRGRRDCSYIYMIFTTEHVYIGETGNIPPARWGNHLGSSRSSFLQKINNQPHTEEQASYSGEFIYIGIHCEVIDQEPKERQKIARLAIEDAIHTEYLLNKNQFGGNKTLLSTSKSVTRHRFGFDVESFAKAAIDLIFKEYQKFGNLLNPEQSNSYFNTD